MESRRHKLFYGSSPDRGLEMLLYIWPDIKKTYPDAELHICYGWKLFDILARTNPERRKWKESVLMMMQHPGVIDHGRVGKEELSSIRRSCGVWAYPTYFTEINCITALDVQKDGLVPVTMALAALKETVGSGILIEGDIKDPKVMKKYKSELLRVMENRTLWRNESKKAQKFAKGYEWEKVAKEWTKEFDKPISNPKVSVITPTIRTGWWNIMAQNLSIQTYKNFEWIIVDDYPKDRSEIAKKYASTYNLDIRYLRGDKGSSYPRRGGLVRANNIGWQNAKGELLIWLQDFILLSKNGIEDIVNLYRHHPNDLLAPVDVYYDALPANKDNLEDWWDSNTKIIVKKNWTNIRVKNEGIRKSDNPFDFEMNFGGIPKKVIEELNGWWEFFDDGIGFDNTEIAVRALNLGHQLIIDDTNIAKCINIWPEVGGTAENVKDRERILNTPRYEWFSNQMKSGKLPLIRDIKLDESVHLKFNVPEGLTDKQATKWINKNAKEIVRGWEEDAICKQKTKGVDAHTQARYSEKVG